MSPGRPAGVCAKPSGPRARLEAWSPFSALGLKGADGSSALLSLALLPQSLSCPLCWSQTSAFAARSVARLLLPDQAGPSGERSPKLSCHLLATGGGDAGSSSACGTRLAWLPNPVEDCESLLCTGAPCSGQGPQAADLTLPSAAPQAGPRMFPEPPPGQATTNEPTCPGV